MSESTVQSETAVRDLPERAYAASLALIVLAAFAVRTVASTGDLWFDEAWTWLLVRELTSPLDVMVMHHDNNHYLMSFYYYLIGDSPHAVVYRIPSIVLGTGTVYLGARLASERGRLEGIITAFLFATSFFLILYSSEARGYGAVTFFAVAAFAAARGVFANNSSAALIAFWLVSILGFLSHLSFGLVSVSIGIWSMVEFTRPGTRLLDWCLGLLRLHAVPFGFLIFVAWIDLSKIVTFPVVPDPFLAIMADAIAHTMRMPAGFAQNWQVVLGVAVLLSIGIVRLARTGNREWVFFLAISLSGPVLYGGSQLILGPLPIIARYFLVSNVFALLLLAYLSADAIRKGPVGIIATVGILGLVLVGNSQLTMDLLEKGRGTYRAALEEVAAHSSEEIVTIASDQDLENGTLFYYNLGHLKTEKRLVYINKKDIASVRPRWYIAHAYNRAKVPKPLIQIGALKYALVETYPAGPYSGFPWFVYQRAESHRAGR